jgi:hypothetical protein
MQQLVQSRMQQAMRAREEHLEELARDPDMAHEEWHRLKEDERSIVIQKMTQHFGADFASAFLEAVVLGRRRNELVYLQPGMQTTSAQLIARGYRRGGMEITGNAAVHVEVWFHPTGRKIRRDVSSTQPVPVEPPEPLLRDPDEDSDDSPYELQDTDELEKLPPTQEFVLRTLFYMRRMNDELEVACSSYPRPVTRALVVQKQFEAIRRGHNDFPPGNDFKDRFTNIQAYFAYEFQRNRLITQRCLKR